MTDSRQQQDYMAEVYEQADRALTAALSRPLTEDEVAVLRYAAGVPAVRVEYLIGRDMQPDIWEI